MCRRWWRAQALHRASPGIQACLSGRWAQGPRARRLLNRSGGDWSLSDRRAEGLFWGCNLYGRASGGQHAGPAVAGAALPACPHGPKGRRKGGPMGRAWADIIAALLRPGPPFKMRGAVEGSGGWAQSGRFADWPPAPRSTKALSSDFFARAAVLASPSACQAPRSISKFDPNWRAALAGARRLGGRAGLPNRQFCTHGARVFCGRMLGFFDSLAGRVSHGPVPARLSRQAIHARPQGNRPCSTAC